VSYGIATGDGGPVEGERNSELTLGWRCWILRSWFILKLFINRVFKLIENLLHDYARQLQVNVVPYDLGT
jgi:hypothetical protein